MRAVSVQAVTLKTFDQGEYDRLYVMVSPEKGKLVVRSYGDRRLHKLVAGHLAPWLLTRVLIKPGRGGWQLVEAETLQQYGRLVGDGLARLHILAEIIDRYALPEEPDQELWRAVTLANELAVADRLSRLSFVEALAQVALAVGLTPCLDRCVVSGDELAADHRLGWSSALGGVIGQEEMSRSAGQHYVLSGASVIKLLRLASTSQRLPSLNIPDEVVAEAEWLLLDYFQVQLDRDLKSLPSLSAVLQ